MNFTRIAKEVMWNTATVGIGFMVLKRFAPNIYSMIK